jgi:hypothetical protein
MSKKRKMNLGLDKSLSGLRSNCGRVLLFEGGGVKEFFLSWVKSSELSTDFHPPMAKKFFFSLFSSHKKNHVSRGSRVSVRLPALRDPDGR